VSRASGHGPIVALDVGGTGMKGAIVQDGATILSEHRWATGREAGPGAVVEAVLGAVDELVAMAGNARAVGIVVPGVVDEAAGVAVYSENILWRDVAFRDIVRERTGLPTILGHDVRAGGVAEWRLGSGEGVDDGLFMPIGTGISGAMRVQGRFVTHPLAGEIGHIDVGSGEACACGGSGCLETIGSAAGIARRYTRGTGTLVTGAREVAELMLAGDTVAKLVWDDAVDALVRALTTYVSLLAPDVVVIGGGLSHAGGLLIDPVRDRLTDALIWQEMPRIVRAELGDSAGCLGAALLAADLIEATPVAAEPQHQENGTS
jgi:glucokinase